MTPEERKKVSLDLLTALERISLAREFGYVLEMREAQAEADRLRQVLRADLLPERGPQGDAAC